LYHVRTILTKLIEHMLVAKKFNCEGYKQKTYFLGHLVGKDIVETDPEKIKTFTYWPQPETIKHMQSFLGFCNHYRNFIKDFSEIVKPLFKMT